MKKIFLDDGSYTLILSGGAQMSFNKNGLKHKVDGPAVKFRNGDELYFKNGLLHNDNGPAIKYKDGHKEYFLMNKKYSKDSYYKQMGGIRNE